MNFTLELNKSNPRYKEAKIRFRSFFSHARVSNLSILYCRKRQLVLNEYISGIHKYETMALRTPIP